MSTPFDRARRLSRSTRDVRLYLNEIDGLWFYTMHVIGGGSETRGVVDTHVDGPAFERLGTAFKHAAEAANCILWEANGGVGDTEKGDESA